ncbi:MAG: ABC transporter permease [Epulopiscium sp.]|jgi:spermidine/putrescine transport system permease protein|nr:ABC transporter permease [Candidatus Epulonipiscium sp.]
MVRNAINRLYLFIIFLFLYAPIIVLIIFSFNDSKSRSHWNGFTLKWYIELFQDPIIKKALFYTITIAILSSLIATVVGTIAAIGIHNMNDWKKTVILNINYLPILNPDIVTGVSLMILFIFARIRLGFLTMLLSHIVFNIPYVILSVLPKLRQLNKHLYEAALDLGATPVYAFFKVMLPELMPGIITGALLAFTLSVDDFVISFFNTSSGVTNLSITIFSMARIGINPKINALSTLMFLTVLILLFIVNIRTSKDIKEEKL